MADIQRASLDLTHVIYDASSHVSLAMALITLSPILLMAAYAVLAVFTREVTVINMWAGQFLCEAFNWGVKRLIKQERPVDSVGNGYGFPSSHSQYMAYFATFLVLHLHFRHRFVSMGSTAVDRLFRLTLHAAFISWAGVVAYSRYHLAYHSPYQVLWGVGLGVLFAVVFYLATELVPTRRPASVLGRIRLFLLSNPVSVWLRVRDGWAVWPDSGTEQQWYAWHTEWQKQTRLAEKKVL
ncbi:PAP2-domain-containing protein [Auriscalpium vulgare]|uniref:PAP2-domain-containing protein n=1 Tax=Auriscalpium vulgare TaxID=40419 RepID=A0ACB8RT20_9AGAM|nr:PAP2-domain-containing protein [Auriscalpium vulgare]